MVYQVRSGDQCRYRVQDWRQDAWPVIDWQTAKTDGPERPFLMIDIWS